VHRLKHFVVAEWIAQPDVEHAAQQMPHAVRDARVRVQHEGHLYIVSASNFAHAGRNRFEPFAPAFPAMAGNQQAPSTRLFHAGSKQRQAFQQGIDAGVSSHFYLPAHAVAAKVRSAQRGRRKQQRRQRVDRDSKVLFGPRVQAVVAAEAGFNVGNRNVSLGCPERAAERARSVALYNDQSRLIQGCPNVSGDIANVKLRVGPTGAGKLHSLHRRHAVVRWLKVGMLSGEDEARADTAMEERFG
jgi:hypothetical protein